MKTFYTIFGGKLMRWLFLFAILSNFAQLSAQPCSNPPTVFLSTSNAVICEGSTTQVMFNINGGTSPWRITYALDGVPQPLIANILTSPYGLTTGTTGTYTVVNIYDALNCQGQVLGGSVTITAVPMPIVEAGPNIQTCAGFDPVQLNALVENYASVTWTSTGNGTFLNPNSPNTLYFPGNSNVSSGSAHLTITVIPLSPCTGQVQDDLYVTIDQGAVCNAGPDAASCGTNNFYVSGSSATDYSTIQWTSNGTGNILNPTAVRPTYIPSQADVNAGSVTLTMNAFGTGNCLNIPAVDQMVIYLTPEPTVNAGSDAMVCEGSSLLINDATASSFSSLNWTTSGTGVFTNNGTLTPTYIPSANDIISGLVTLTLTASPLSPCAVPETSSKNVTFSLNPIVNAGPDGRVCDNNPFTINDATAVNHFSVMWTTSGSGTFTNATSVNTSYIPSNNDVLSGSVILTLTAYGNPLCNLSDADDKILTIIKSPVINAGVNGTVCENSTFTVTTATAANYSGILWTSNGTGSLSNATTLTPSYTPSHNDGLIGSVTLTMSATGITPCNTNPTDAMQLTVVLTPVANAGNDLSTCSTTPVLVTGASAQNFSSIVWTTSGTGIFINANSLTPTYTPSNADVSNGSVSLRMTLTSLSPCTGSVYDELTLTIIPNPTANAGFDATSCDGTYLITGASATSYSSLSWTTSGTGMFTNASTLTPTYTASAQDILDGAVSLHLTVQGQSPCSQPVTDNMILTLQGPPVANAGVNSSVCEGSTFQVTTATASNYGSLNWTTSGSGTFSGQNTIFPVYSPSNADILNGSVVLRLTAGSIAPCNLSVYDEMTLTIVRSPRAYSGPNQSICEGNSATLNGTITGSTMFAWTTSGDGTFTSASTLTPTYFPGLGDIANGSAVITLTAYPSGVCYNVHSDNMIINIARDAQVYAGSDQNICSNTFTLSDATASYYSSLSWSTSGTGTFINGTLLNATYMASAADIAMGSVTLRLTATGIPPCAGLMMDEMVLTFTPQPTAFAGIDASTCGNSYYTLSDASAENYSSVTWSTSGSGTFSNTSEVNPTYFPSATDLSAGFVTLTISATGFNLCNLTASDEMVLSFNTQPVVDAGPDLTSCGTLPIQVTGATASTYSSIYWTTNGTGTLQNATGIYPVYTPSQADILAGQITLTLHAVASSPCTGEVTDDLIIYLHAGPQISAGADITICENQYLIITGATATGYASLLWNTSGSGTFSNSSALNPVYNPSQGDILAGTVTLTLTASGTSPCNIIASDPMILTINPLPVSDAGPDIVTCENSYQLVLANALNYSSLNWTTSGTGSFTNASVLNAVYTPSSADLSAGFVILTLSVNGQNPCNDQSVDNMTLTFGNTIMANAGSDEFTCESNPFTVTTSSASPNSSISWTTSGSGSFVNQNTLNPTYTPSTADILAGSVNLTMLAQGSAPCYATADDSMILNISSSPTVYAGTDGIICTGDTYSVTNATATNYAALSWSTSGSGTFTSGNTLNPTYNPSALDYQNGSVTLQLSALPLGTCSGSVFDEMLLTFDTGATVSAGQDEEICAGLNFTVSSASASGTVNISWSSTGNGTFINQNTISPTYIPSDDDRIAGSVILTITAVGNTPCANTATDNMTLTINAIPTGLVTIVGTPELCAGQTGVMYSIIPPVQFATSYEWVLLTGATIVAGNNTSNITVDFSLTSQSGTIYVTPSNDCGNGPTGSYDVIVNPAPANPGPISGPTEVCKDTEVLYSVEAVTGTTGYVWTVPTGATITSGDGTNSILVSFSNTAVSGNISVRISNSCGIGEPSVLAINVSPLPAPPVITANGPVSFCNGGSVVLTASAGYTSYLWSNGMVSSSITVTDAGTYSVVGINNIGCSSLPSNEITVIINYPATPVITASGPLTFCNGGGVTLSATPGFVSYLWSNGETTQSIVVTQAGTYTVTAIDAAGCTSLPSTPVYVTVNAPVAPIITANGPLDFCLGGVVVLSAPGGYQLYLWSSGETTQTISASVSGNYFVQVTDINGCTSDASNIISVNVTNPPAPNAGGDSLICAGSSFFITTATAANYTSLQWSSSGTGTWLNGNTVNATYIPSNADIAIGLVNLTLTASNAYCPDEQDFMVLTIQSQVNVNAGPDGSTCEGNNFMVTGASASLSSSLLWTSSGSGVFNNTAIINPIYTPSPADVAAGNVQLRITGTSAACGNTAFDDLILYIRQEPQANAGADATICQGDQYVITDALSANYSSLVWITSGSGNFLNGSTLTPTYIPSQLDVLAGSVVLTLIASNPPCGDIIDSKVLTITPVAFVEAGPDATICQLCSHTVSGAFVNNAESFTWTSTGSGTFANANTLTPTYQPSAADIGIGSVTLILSADSYLGCGTFSDQMVIYINQNTSLDFTWEGTCNGQPTNFIVDESITPVGEIAVWNWDFGDGFFSNVMNPVHTFAATGAYNVTLTTTDTLGNQSIVSHVVDIQSTPVSFFSIETPNCLNNETQFINLSSTGNGYITQWIWNFGDGSPTVTVLFPDDPNVTHTYTTQATFEVSLTVINSFGCENTYTDNVSITPAPIANFYHSPSCENMIVDFQDASSPNGAGNIVSWNWNFGDPASGVNNTSNLNNPQHIYASPGIYTVTLYVVNFNNCTDTITKEVNAGVAPPVAFSWDASCANTLTSFFTDASVVNTNAISNYLWDFGDGGQATIQDPQHMYQVPGLYTVTLTVTDSAGCTNSVSNLINISESPAAFFNFSSPVCSESSMQFTDLSVSAAGYITSWEWNFGDGNSTAVFFPNSPNVSHQYSGFGSYNVTLKITSSLGCQDSVTRTVTVIPAPTANFSYMSTCLNLPVFFNDLSQANGGGQIIGWAWDFGDVNSGTGNFSSLSNPTHIYAQPGTYIVALTVTTSNGCTDTYTSTVSILPAPVVDFAFTTGCSGSPVAFISSTYVNLSTTQSWYWDFGDGTTSSEIDPEHIYPTAGNYTVTLVITDLSGCTGTASHQVNIIPGPVAIFTSNAPGCTGSEVQFDDMSNAIGSAVIQWHWNFGDGNDITVVAPGNPDVSHAYSQSGLYNVTLTVSNHLGCTASVTNSVTIINGPLTDFTFTTGCAGSPVQFTDQTSVNGGTPVIQWAWNFGDPASGTSNTSSIQNPVHTFSTSGTFSVSLTTTSMSGCQSVHTQQVTITAPPAIAFIYSSNCATESILFEPDQAIMNPNTIDTWLWDFGDGTATSTQMSPSHVYALHGIYNVTLTAVNVTGCVSTITTPVSIAAIPVTSFSSSSTCSGNETSFTDYSYSVTGEPIVAWSWSFGDPTAVGGADTSNIQHPIHTYDNAGTYFVSLIATSSSGCSSMSRKSVEIVSPPTANYTFNTNSCQNGKVAFTDASSAYMGAVNAWEWEFTPYNYSNLQHPVHTFSTTDSCYDVRLVVTDIRGCTDTTVKQVCVPAGLEVDIENTVTCLGENTFFTPVLVSPSTATLVSYLWNFDDLSSGVNNTSTLQNPEHYFANTGNYLVSLVVTDENNCTSAPVYRNVEIQELPNPNFSYVEGNCDSTIYFTDLSSSIGASISKWIWNYGDGVIDTLYSSPANTAHYYTTTGTFEVTLTTVTSSGCSKSYNTTFIKVPCIVAGFDQLEPLICEGSTYTFIDNSLCGNPISDWMWYFGDGKTLNYNSYQPEVKHSYEASGDYDVSLVVATNLAGSIVYDTITRVVTVLASPVANFTTSDVCLNATTGFRDESQAIQSQINSWNWNFGDPESVSDFSSDRNPSYKYPRTGQFTTSLIVTNKYGCADTVAKNIYVHNYPTADFDFSISCQEKYTYFTDMSDSADGPISYWWWKFKDEETTMGLAGVQDPYFVFQETGDYEVQLIVKTNIGCADTISKTVTVNPRPTSAFSITENYESIQGQVLFTNGSIGAEAYEWNFGTGLSSFAIDPVVTFPSDGEYEVMLVTYNEYECPDTLKMKYTLLYKGLWVPNAFSPNNPNAKVRQLKPIGINLQSYLFEVYDTWGNILWSTNKLDENGSPAEGWTGVVNGNLLPQDTYLWKASAVFKDGTIWNGKNVGSHEKMPEYSYGSVHLIR